MVVGWVGFSKWVGCCLLFLAPLLALPSHFGTYSTTGLMLSRNAFPVSALVSVSAPLSTPALFEI